MALKKNLNKILITGAGGIVGSYFTLGLRMDKKDLDVTDISSVEKVISREKPKVIIHLAALTDMKFCEENEDLAYKINENGARNIALVAKKNGAKVIYISTNAVFDGKKKESYVSTDVPNPANVYGNSKYKGEIAVLGVDSKNLVIRSSWIFGGGKERDKKFVGKISPKLFSGETIQAVSDVNGTPTYGKDLVKAVEQAIIDNRTGVIHIANDGKATRYDMAFFIKNVLGSKSEIRPATLASFKIVGNTLKNEKLASDIKLRSWQDALREYLETEWKNSIKK